MLKLYGVARSRATRVIWLLNEIGMEYEHVPVIQAYRLKDPHAAGAPFNTLSPDFLRLSPQGAIPVLVDGDLVLAESLAINLHLARTQGGTLGPKDVAEDALMVQWALYGATAIEPSALAIFYVHAEGRARTDEGRAAIAAAADMLRRPFAVLDAHLAKAGWLVGGRFTVADINMAEIVRYGATDAALMTQFPALAGWLEKLHERDAFKAMWAQRLAEPA